MFISNSILWRKPPTIWSYGIAVLSVAVALIASRWPGFRLQDAPVSLFLCAVLLSAWFGGIGPAMLATALSTLAFYYYYLPPVPRLVIFMVSTVLIGSLSAALRSAAESLRRTHEDLMGTVRQLQSANEALQAESRQRERAQSEVRRSEVFLSQAQRLSNTGSFSWRPSTGQILWSEETFRIFEYDRTTTPTVEFVLKRIHREDLAHVKQTIERASQDGKDFDHEYRLVMPDGAVKHVHVVAHAERAESGEVEFVGAVMDTTESKLAEKKLRRSEESLLEAQRLSHTGSWRHDVASGAVTVSPEIYRMHDIRSDEDASNTEFFFGRFHPEDRKRVVHRFEKAETEKTEFQVDYRIVLPDGTIKHLHTIGHPVLNESGDLVEFVGTAIDVTERKWAEALREGQSRVLEMIARDAPLVQILENLVLVVEAQFAGLLCSILLLDEDGQHLRHGAAPSLPKPYIKAIDGLRIGPKAGSCGTAMYRREPVVVTDILQDPLWEAYRQVAEPYGLRACWSTPMLSHSGKVLGSFAMYYREPRSPSTAETHALEMATHLTGIAIERKLAREQLQRSEAYLAEAQRLSHTGSWAGAPGPGEITYWSEECYRVLGFDPRRDVARLETFVQRIHPDDRARTMEQLEEASRERTGFEFHYRIVHPGGEIRDIHTVGHPVFSPSGDLVEYVGTVIDVTERKRAEEALHQSQAELAHVNRVTTMGELTASLAHEVNQPIAAAVTDANTCLRWLMRDQPDAEEARAAAARVVKDATRAAEIINRVRLLFKKSAPEWELVDVNEVIPKTIVLLYGEAARYDISVRADLAADLPQVIGDPVQLQQVIMNLIVNSIDAMKDVEGSREIVIRSQRTENEHVLVSVIDTGVGLPQQQSSQIFNAFFTTKSHGTGLGLRISRSIVESHGGRLWAADNSPRGASFNFTLPTKIEEHESEKGGKYG
jgi:PAS domain S-box-containing protein